jgi:serine phosphatase RsbU (regulator of sigma subunit)/anti-sigma regulatory factor (Ser/Thr protein kinase)
MANPVEVDAGTTTSGSGANNGADHTLRVADAVTNLPASEDASTSGRRGLTGRLRRKPAPAAQEPSPDIVTGPELDIAPNDPILAYFHETPGVVDIRTLTLDSPALEQMREAGVVLVVPLVTSGELVGLLQLGPRLSERDYSKDDRQLLESLARYAAPALRLGQMVRQQEVEARSRERYEQELKVAQLIQQQFLPKSLPDLPTWHIAAFYRPARTVGGDFYDFINLADGRVMVVTGDVTDKGVPAALVMSSTHALLRETGPRLKSPSAVLARVNDLLCEDIPAHMFVTCLAMVLDPPTGRVDFANAGHNLPYVRGVDGVVRELRATGMPLGLMPGMTYEQSSAVIDPGEQLLLYSDGITEQHNGSGEMFGFGRTAEVVARARTGDELTDLCVSELAAFTGPDVEQEDDITLVALQRTQGAAHGVNAPGIITAFSLPSEPGNEREALARVAASLTDERLTPDQLERLKTAVAEATMNAIEHGNHNQYDLPVDIAVIDEGTQIAVTVTDRGGSATEVGSTHPDLELKLAGLQTPRGWGLFLIKNMVDEVDQTIDADRHTLRLVMRLSPDATTQEEGSDVDV